MRPLLWSEGDMFECALLAEQFSLTQAFLKKNIKILVSLAQILSSPLAVNLFIVQLRSQVACFFEGELFFCKQYSLFHSVMAHN